jgi:hypothetical protein
MTDLSPAAAVLDAYEKVWSQGYGSPLSAALRAAAEILSQDEMDHYAPDILNDIAAELDTL